MLCSISWKKQKNFVLLSYWNCFHSFLFIFYSTILFIGNSKTQKVYYFCLVFNAFIIFNISCLLFDSGFQLTVIFPQTPTGTKKHILVYLFWSYHIVKFFDLIKKSWISFYCVPICESLKSFLAENAWN